MMLFRNLRIPCANSERRKSIYTNMIHRIMVIFIEDVGMGGLHVLPAINALIKIALETDWMQDEDGAIACGAIDEAMMLMLPVEKGRITSHIRAFLYDQWRKGLRAPINVEEKIINDPLMPTDPNSIDSAFYDALVAKDSLAAFNIAHSVYQNITLSPSEHVKWRARFIAYARTVFVHHVLTPRIAARAAGDLINQASADVEIDFYRSIFDALTDWALELKSLRECFICHTLAILMCTMEYGAPAHAEMRGCAYTREHMRAKGLQIFAHQMNESAIEFDEYVIDKHTFVGSSKLGKTTVDFIKEGSKVFPESIQWSNAEWKECHDALP